MTDHADALVLTGPRVLERRSFSLPELAEGEALLRIEACGLCGTDHEQYSAHIAAPFEFVPGHEIVGVIEAVDARGVSRWGVAHPRDAVR